MLWLFLAAQLSLPVPLHSKAPDIRALFKADDFPDHLQRAGLSRVVYSRTTVRTDGSIEGCVAEESSGDRQLDTLTCRIIMKRAKFAAAKWLDGSAVIGVLRFPVKWLVFEVVPPPEKLVGLAVPDLDLQVNALPKGAPPITPVEVTVAVDESGKIVDCADRPPTAGSPFKHLPELAPIACTQAATRLRLSPPKDLSAKPVRSVQNVLVHFHSAKN